MKKILLFIGVVLSVQAFGIDRATDTLPYPSKISTPTAFRHLRADSALGFPYGPTASLRYTGYEIKPGQAFYQTSDSSLYIWSGTQFRKSGGSGGSADGLGLLHVVADYGLLNVNDSTLKFDSATVFSDLTLDRILLSEFNPGGLAGFYNPVLKHDVEIDMNTNKFFISNATDFAVNLNNNEWAISGSNGGSNTTTIISTDIQNRIRIIAGFSSTNKTEIDIRPDSIVLRAGGDGKINFDSLRDGSSYSVNKIIGWRDNNGVVGYITPGYGIDLVAGILKADTNEVVTPYDLTQLNKYRFGATGEDDDIQDDRYANFHDENYLYLDSLFGFGASFNGNEGYSITNLTTNSLMLRLNDAAGAQLLSPNGSNYIQVLDDQMNLILANAANDSLMINDINEVTKDDGDYVLVQRGSVGSKRISKVPVADFGSGGTPTLQEVTTAGNTTFNPISITYSSAGTSAFSTINQNVGSAIYASNTGSGMVGNFELEHTSTNTVRTIVSYSRSTTGTTSAGLGQKHSYLLEADAGGSYEAASLNILWDDATEGAATSRVVFNTMGAGSVLNTLTLNGNGQIQFNEYTGSNFNTAQAKVAMVGTDGKIYAVDTTGLFGGGGGGGGITQEQSEDFTGAMFATDNGDIDFTYNDATPDIAASIKNLAVTNAKINDVAWGKITSVPDAVADGSTKGVASFTANDFNSSSGNISLDYTNGQAASGSNKGFLTSADWTTFNNKISFTYSRNMITATVTGTDANITAAAGTAYHLPAATISAGRTIDVTNLNSDGDYAEFYNNEEGFVWSFTGATVYDSDGATAVTELLINANSVIRRINGKLMISRL